MNFFVLFLVAGIAIVISIIQYDKRSRKRVSKILKENKNVPPLLMLRSAETKVNAIKTAINTGDEPAAEQTEFKKEVTRQLEQLMAGYTSQQIALSAYYAKLGALLISVNEIKRKKSAA